MMNKPMLLILLICMIAGIGCSSSERDPIMSGSGDNELQIPVTSGEDASRSLIGSWDVRFDLDSMTAEITANRDLTAHINITNLIPPPGITINGFNPATNVVDVDFTISNPHQIDGYDVRLIVYTNNLGHMLLNADNWTDLWNIPGGLPISPFKAYAKDQSNRIFASNTQHTENLLIYLPGGNPNVSFAVDASYPGNALEPYEITGFTQGTLEDIPGSSTQLNVIVRDWQNDTNAVSLFCPAITGGGLMSFSHAGGENWQGTLYNNAGASPGNYTGYLLATSANSGSQALYEQVDITVVKGQVIAAPANLSIKVNRLMASNKRINTAVPFTLNWDAVPSAQEYAIYYDYEPANPDYFVFVGTVSGGQTSFNVPSFHLPPNQWVKGYKYIVRARAVAGDSSSESPNSNIAFVKVSGFDSLANQSTLNNQLAHRENWVTAVERYPYATDTGIAYWPNVSVAHHVSEPYSLNIVPTYLGSQWTVGTGQNTDYAPGRIMAITYEIPYIPNATTKKIDFVASCAGNWDARDEGGVIIGSSNAHYQPKDGWDGSDFRWAPSGTAGQGYRAYNWRHTSSSNPFPFDMQDYTAGQNNCWRWRGG